jgi:magnesium transporter
MALREVTLADWWRVALRELPSGAVLGLILGVIGITRIALWQHMGWYN